ncbi:hypothetical protein AK812_SmicGene49100 [Symbiodinium microadriaticum]|uniref:Uncharacterized protein n=1 Tax=Symbiodinium microadriaticum TaxID=2951 RepID=A0A1Q9DNN9_SYMMI|nr:hypothetical protein AK812_SmicGene49100 [Symbiodinium microadriaticum]
MLGRLLCSIQVGGRPNPIRAAWPVADPSLGLGARQLVVPAREFKAILEGVGETSKAYAGNPLAQLCPKRRGQVLQNAVRQVLSQKHSDMQVEDPFPGIGIRGTRLRPDQARYDFSIGGRRVECKSAQLCWYQAEVRWKAQFCGIKLDQNQFDDLYLALFTPSNVLVLQHDLHTCMSRAGRHTAELGWRVTVGGRKHQTNWRDANVALAKQLFNADSNCRPVAVLQVNGPEISVALSHASGSRSKQLADKFYKESPLQLANPSTRGLRIEAIAFELDKRMHPEALFLRSAADKARTSSSGSGLHATCADWLRNGTRVEVKHGVLRFKDQRCVWTCSFTGIRSTTTVQGDVLHFDELWLVVLGPRGLHIFRDDGELGIARASHLCRGGRIEVCGPYNEPEPHVAFERILQKLTSRGCTLLATVPF